MYSFLSGREYRHTVQYCFLYTVRKDFYFWSCLRIAKMCFLLRIMLMYFQKYNCQYITFFLLKDFKGHLRKWVLKMFKQTIRITKLKKLIFLWRFSNEIRLTGQAVTINDKPRYRTEPEFGIGTTRAVQHPKNEFARNPTLRSHLACLSLG